MCGATKMGNNATKMAQDAMGATKKAQMAVGSGLQSMNKCISKETGEREDAAMSLPTRSPPLPLTHPRDNFFLWENSERCADPSAPAPPSPPLSRGRQELGVAQRSLIAVRPGGRAEVDGREVCARRGVPVTIGLHGPEIVIDGDGMRVSGQGVIPHQRATPQTYPPRHRHRLHRDRLLHLLHEAFTRAMCSHYSPPPTPGGPEPAPHAAPWTCAPISPIPPLSAKIT